MKSLMKYLKDYKKECVLSPLFKLLEATFELFVPLVMAAVIDKGIGHADKPYIVKMCLVLIALGIIGLVCSITALFFAAKEKYFRMFCYRKCNRTCCFRSSMYTDDQCIFHCFSECCTEHL